MRLSTKGVNIIKSSILKYCKDATIILFGSRVYDEKKGGDIDIFVETNQTLTFKEKIKILTNIELTGILRKVDLVFKTPDSKDEPIFNTAKEEGIAL